LANLVPQTSTQKYTAAPYGTTPDQDSSTPFSRSSPPLPITSPCERTPFVPNISDSTLVHGLFGVVVDVEGTEAEGLFTNRALVPGHGTDDLGGVPSVVPVPRIPFGRILEIGAGRIRTMGNFRSLT